MALPEASMVVLRAVLDACCQPALTVLGPIVFGVVLVMAEKGVAPVVSSPHTVTTGASASDAEVLVLRDTMKVVSASIASDVRQARLVLLDTVVVCVLTAVVPVAVRVTGVVLVLLLPVKEDVVLDDPELELVVELTVVDEELDRDELLLLEEVLELEALDDVVLEPDFVLELEELSVVVLELEALDDVVEVAELDPLDVVDDVDVTELDVDELDVELAVVLVLELELAVKVVVVVEKSGTRATLSCFGTR